MSARLFAQAPDPFTAFFDAENPQAALAQANKLIGANIDFDTAYARLKKGRTYGDEKKGEFALRWRSSFLPFFNNIVRSVDYDPAGPPVALRVQPRRHRTALAKRHRARTRRSEQAAPAASRASGRLSTAQCVDRRHLVG